MYGPMCCKVESQALLIGLIRIRRIVRTYWNTSLSPGENELRTPLLKHINWIDLDRYSCIVSRP